MVHLLLLLLLPIALVVIVSALRAVVASDLALVARFLPFIRAVEDQLIGTLSKLVHG